MGAWQKGVRASEVRDRTPLPYRLEVMPKPSGGETPRVIQDAAIALAKTQAADSCASPIG
jgi:hypothetical protein